MAIDIFEDDDVILFLLENQDHGLQAFIRERYVKTAGPGIDSLS
jgi:hypothetical protein